jgi:dephospho-CoA kinase
MRRIAVTGGIAEGKSTVAGYLRDLGHRTLSADDVAREVFQSEEVQEALASLLAVPLPLEPAAVRRAIARDSRVRRHVNALTHPRISLRLASAPERIVEVPLLIEACLQGSFDRIWVVTCGPAEQLRRLTERLGSAEEASRLIRTQLPSTVKCAFADVIIRTNQDRESVLRCVSEAVRLEIG